MMVVERDTQWVGGNGIQKLGMHDWWRAYGILEPQLSEAAIRVAIRIYMHYNEKRGAFPSIETLCRGGHGRVASDSGVRNGIRELERVGLIEVDSGKDSGRASTYWFTIPGSGRIGNKRTVTKQPAVTGGTDRCASSEPGVATGVAGGRHGGSDITRVNEHAVTTSRVCHLDEPDSSSSESKQRKQQHQPPPPPPPPSGKREEFWWCCWWIDVFRFR